MTRTAAARWGVPFLAALLIALLAAAPAGAARNANPGVLPIQTGAHGGYADLSARWWQAVLAIPTDANPLTDETGARCAAGDQGDVFFLVGVINVSGSAARTCAVPAGEALFFPLLNVECSTLEPPPFHGDTPAELQACAAGFTNPSDPTLEAEIDGVTLHDLTRYRPPCCPVFDFSVPAANVLGVAGPATGTAAADGFWLLLAPLSAGAHTIHFAGGDPAVFRLDITYHLTVAG